MKHERVISLPTIDRIMLAATGRVDIELDAQIELGKILETVGLEILERAIKIQKHTGRKTIRGDDIRCLWDMHDNKLKEMVEGRKD